MSFVNGSGSPAGISFARPSKIAAQRRSSCFERKTIAYPPDGTLQSELTYHKSTSCRHNEAHCIPVPRMPQNISWRLAVQPTIGPEQP